MDSPTKVVSGSAAGGALFGLLFLVSVAGVVLGGALFGRLSKAGIDKSFRDRVPFLLSPGKAAAVIMSRERTEDKSTDALEPVGDRILWRPRCQASRRGSWPRILRLRSQPAGRSSRHIMAVMAQAARARVIVADVVTIINPDRRKR